MELEVMRLLAAEARAAGRDPASDPVPGLTRDVLFASVADEEAGGLNGAAYLALAEPDTVRAAAAINEAGGVAVRRRVEAALPDPGGGEGRDRLPPDVQRDLGPRLDAPGRERDPAGQRRGCPALARRGPARLTDVTRAAPGRTIEALAERDGVPPEAIRLLRAAASGDSRASALGSRRCACPVYARALDAMLRDTLSPNILHGGVKYNIIPGVATLEVDVRRLPGTTDGRDGVADPRAPRARALGGHRDRDRHHVGRRRPPVRGPRRALPDPRGGHPRSRPRGDPPAGDGAVRHRRQAPASSSACRRTASRRCASRPGETYIERWHGIDERVSIDGLRWGLPVLYDAVRRFCG